MYDAVIIGAGPGGYECARIISELGGKAAIIEKDKLGGTCTNYGCIPTKTLHASASFFSSIKVSHEYGFNASIPNVELSKIMERKQHVVDMLSNGVKRILDAAKVDIFSGEAKIESPGAVAVNGQKLETRTIVIATGARPRLLDGISLSQDVMTSKEILELKELPKTLTIIGGGYIGSEFASIFLNLGTKVTIVEGMQRIVMGEDTDISKELTRIMIREGAQIITDAKITRGDGTKVFYTKNSQEQFIESEKVLVAVGVDSYFSKEEMNRLGIKYSAGIDVNEKMQTSAPNIYAVGDVTGQIKLAHYAYAQAEVAASNIMGKEMFFDNSVVPSAIFTIPEISSVGIRNQNLKSVIFNFAANGKARAMHEPDGFVKVYYDNGMLKGFCAIGPHCSDLVAEATLAIKNQIPLEKIKHTIHVHPTLSEAFHGAIEKALEDKS